MKQSSGKQPTVENGHLKKPAVIAAFKFRCFCDLAWFRTGRTQAGASRPSSTCSLNWGIGFATPISHCLLSPLRRRPGNLPGRVHPASRLQLPKLVHGKPRPATARTTLLYSRRAAALGLSAPRSCQARQGHVCRNKQYAKNKATSSPYRPTTATNPRAIALRSRIENPAERIPRSRRVPNFCSQESSTLSPQATALQKRCPIE